MARLTVITVSISTEIAFLVAFDLAATTQLQLCCVTHTFGMLELVPVQVFSLNGGKIQYKTGVLTDVPKI